MFRTVWKPSAEKLFIENCAMCTATINSQKYIITAISRLHGHCQQQLQSWTCSKKSSAKKSTVNLQYRTYYLYIRAFEICDQSDGCS